MPINTSVSGGGSGGGSSVVGEFSAVTLAQQVSNSTTFEDVVGSSLSLTAGTWELIYTVSTDHSTGDNTLPHLAITDSANAIVPGSMRSRAGGSTSLIVLSAAVQVTISAAATYKLRYQRGGGGALTIVNSAVGNSTFTCKKISGYLPVSGEIVEYISLVEPANNTNVAVASGAAFLFTGSGLNTGNIPYNSATGQFTLAAGKTYALRAAATTASGGGVSYRWRNDTTSTLVGGVGFNNGDNGASGNQTQSVATYTITPSVTTLVSLRNINAGSAAFPTNIAGAVSAYVDIVQLGATATTTTTRVVVQASHTTGQSILNAVTTALTGWTEQKDTVGAFDAATGVFTAPRASDYTVSFTCGYAGFTSIGNGVVSAEIAGSVAKGAYFPIANGAVIDSVSPALTVIVALAAGQTITMQTFQNTGAARALHTGANRTHLSIMEIEAAY